MSQNMCLKFAQGFALTYIDQDRLTLTVLSNNSSLGLSHSLDVLSSSELRRRITLSNVRK